MSICRTILAILIALSVATLPVAGGAATIAASADASISEPMSPPMAEPMVDCDHRAMPCHERVDDCQSMAACALKCFNFSGTSFSILSFPVVLKAGEPVFADSGFHPQTSSPPLRPPRI